MFRLWGKVYQNNRIIKDMVYEDDRENVSYKDKTSDGLENICYTFDLQNPMWLTDNIKEYEKYSKASFKQDHFIEQIEFDYLEIEVIEKDK